MYNYISYIYVFSGWFQGKVTAFMETYIADMNYVEQ